MIYLIYTIHILVCFFLILVVLLQQGKGADLSVFGGGSTQTAFGAVGATSLLHKLTVGSFILFILTTMTIAIIQGSGMESSVVTDAAVQEEAAPEEAPAAETGAPTTEGAIPEANPEPAPEGETGPFTEATDPGEARPQLDTPAEGDESGGGGG